MYCHGSLLGCHASLGAHVLSCSPRLLWCHRSIGTHHTRGLLLRHKPSSLLSRETSHHSLSSLSHQLLLRHHLWSGLPPISSIILAHPLLHACIHVWATLLLGKYSLLRRWLHARCPVLCS